MISEFKACPHCAEPVQRNALLCRFCDRGISGNHFKNCPRCSEMIWTAAVFCRYCKSEFKSLGDWDKYVAAGTVKEEKSGIDRLAANKIKLGGHMLDDDAIEQIFSKRMKQEK